MKFTLKRKDIAGDVLEFECPFWGANIKVQQNGKTLPRLKEKNRPCEILMSDGTRKKLFWRSRWLDPVPLVFIENEEAKLAEPLRTIDHIFACFPISMFLIYGAFSTVIGFFLLMANFRILRTKMQPTIKWAAIYALDIVVFWLVAAIVNFVIAKGK